ncbi:S-layer homology domain-containing protein [Paenibacillus andongensis]|uniref:S-layer homology domain-containing protein n=1 Tax=Paenibacillus andongensis TaxID=2975482 RepID=UPI0021BAAAED|nr:S-layer homology domain-containing protein [Paenibacillus andongensis]
MKKTLSVVLTSAMALSMFSSVAFGKTSADFTDLKDLDAATKVKFDAMITAGIFDGVTETTFGLKDEMNRAQFAKVAALIMGLEVNKDLKTSTFTDVSVTDAANGYALPYIEALKTAGVTDGYADGQYNPAGKVTKEQLATFLVRVLGQDAAAKGKTGTDTTVSGWAQGYVALALELKLLSNGTDGTFGGMANATRDLLVTGAYEAKQQYVPAGKVSVTGAKATGVQQVTVSFNKPVDTAKATVALTKGTADIATTVKFADDKKSAVLTLTDVKVSEGSYTATLSGLDAAGVDKTTATFTAENEKVTKLSFVNASDKIAKSAKVTVKVKAENQYGENASLNGSEYTAYVSGRNESLKRNEDTGLLELTLNTIYKNGVSGDQTQSEIDVLPVNIFLTNTSVSVQKTFKIGVESYVSKIELGTVKYPANKTSLTEQGDVAEFGITRYDQYGDVIAEGALTTDRTKFDAIITPFSNDTLKLKAETVQSYDTVKLELAKNTDKGGDYTVTVYVGSSSATATVSVKSAKVANKVEFGTFNGVIAQGDGATYLPIVAYDADGKQLTAQDIVDNAKADRFSISISGADYDTARNGNAAIVTSGEHKGQIKIDNVTATSKGVVFVNLGIFSANVQNSVQKSFTVQDVRVPETIAVKSAVSANKALVGGETTVKWYVQDQYGAKLDDSAAANAADYKLKVTVTGSAYATFSGLTGGTTVGEVTTYDGNDLTGFNEKELKFVATAAGKAKVTAELVKGTATLKKVENELEVTADTDLTYSVTAIDSVFAARDNDLTPGADKVLTGTTNNAFDSKLAKEIKITATNKSGEIVAIPGNRISSVSSSDNNIVNVIQEGNAAKVIGNKAGKATVTVVYNTFDGMNKYATLEVNSKADLVATAKIVADANATYDLSTPTADVIDLANVVITDNYGVEYETAAEINKYNGFLGAQYIVSDIQASGAANTVVVNADGTLTVGANVTEFVLKTISGGKTATTLVVVQP